MTQEDGDASFDDAHNYRLVGTLLANINRLFSIRWIDLSLFYAETSELSYAF